MTPSQKLTRARHCVHAYCQEQFPEETVALHDSIFISDGFYRGRRFRCEQASAVWFAEEDQLKIHTPEGECVASWNATEMAERVERFEQRELGEPIESQESVESQQPSTLPMIAADARPQSQVEIRRAA